MNRELLTLYGLKWNPFATNVPSDSLLATPAVDSFCRRIEAAPRAPGRLRPGHRRARHRKERHALRLLARRLAGHRRAARRWRSPTRPPGSPTSTTRWARSSASP